MVELDRSTKKLSGTATAVIVDLYTLMCEILDEDFSCDPRPSASVVDLALHRRLPWLRVNQRTLRHPSCWL